MKFSDQVKHVRMKLEMNQDELAKELGVAKSTISRWESDGRNPQLAVQGKFYNFCERNNIRFEKES